MNKIKVAHYRIIGVIRRKGIPSRPNPDNRSRCYQKNPLMKPPKVVSDYMKRIGAKGGKKSKRLFCIRKCLLRDWSGGWFWCAFWLGYLCLCVAIGVVIGLFLRRMVDNATGAHSPAYKQISTAISKAEGRAE